MYTFIEVVYHHSRPKSCYLMRLISDMVWLVWLQSDPAVSFEAAQQAERPRAVLSDRRKDLLPHH